MDQRFVELDSINYRRAFPWVNLFRAMRFAFDIRKLLLATAAVALLSVGNWAIGYLPFANRDAGNRNFQREIFDTRGQAGNATYLMDDSRPVYELGNWRPLAPLRTFLDPLTTLAQPQETWSKITVAWTRLLWALILWSIFGGAITRMAAVQFARDDRVSIWSALKFSLRNFIAYFFAPLVPIVAIAALWSLMYLIALPGGFSGVGPLILSFEWPVAMLLGLVITLISIGVVVGWPLVYATISVEGSDGFDAFSRPFSYVYGKPWYTLWLGLVAVVFGSVAITIAYYLLTWILYFAEWPLLAASSDQTLTANTIGVNAAEKFSGWRTALDYLFAGYVTAYFWSATTIAYFLLRKADDATDFDEVFVDERDEEDELLNVVGVAASDQPIIERPSRPPADHPEDTDSP